MKLNLMKNICYEIQPLRGCGFYAYDSNSVSKFHMQLKFRKFHIRLFKFDHFVVANFAK